MDLVYQVEVSNRVFTVTQEFSEVFQQFIFEGRGQKSPLHVFSSWLVQNQSLHTLDDLELLALCMSGLVKPLTPKQKECLADEKIRAEVFKFLKTSKDNGEEKTQNQAFEELSKRLHQEFESIRTSYFRACKKFKSADFKGRFEIAEHLDMGQYIIRLIL